MGDTFNISQTPDSSNLIVYPAANYDVNLTASSGNNYECVDEIWSSPNDNTDYVSHASDSVVSDWYSCVSHTTESGTINYVRVVARAVSHEIEQSIGSYYILINDGSTASKSSDLAPIRTSYRKYYCTWNKTPSGATWTWDDIDDMRIGIQCSSPSVTKSYTETITVESEYNKSYAFSTNGAATTGECVDDVPHDGDDTYITTYSTAAYIDFNMTDINPTYNVSSIDNVTAFNVARSTSNPGEDVKCRINSTEVGSLAEDISNVFTTRSAVSLENPKTSTAWTRNDISDVSIGIGVWQNADSRDDVRITSIYGTVDYTIFDNPQVRTTQVYAVVNYTPAATSVSLSMPDSLSVSHSRNIGRFNFPDGDYEIADFGRGGKTLTISGVERTSTVSHMQDIKDMCHYGNEVTISDLPDTNLNTNYLIQSFSWEDQSYNSEANDRIYRWTLTLEEA